MDRSCLGKCECVPFHFHCVRASSISISACVEWLCAWALRWSFVPWNRANSVSVRAIKPPSGLRRQLIALTPVINFRFCEERKCTQMFNGSNVVHGCSFNARTLSCTYHAEIIIICSEHKGDAECQPRNEAILLKLVTAAREQTSPSNDVHVCGDMAIRLITVHNRPLSTWKVVPIILRCARTHPLIDTTQRPLWEKGGADLMLFCDFWIE